LPGRALAAVLRRDQVAFRRNGEHDELLPVPLLRVSIACPHCTACRLTTPQRCSSGEVAGSGSPRRLSTPKGRTRRCKPSKSSGDYKCVSVLYRAVSRTDTQIRGRTEPAGSLCSTTAIPYSCTVPALVHRGGSASAADRCCCSGSAGQRSLVYSSSDPARVLYTHPYCRLAHSASGAAARIRTVPDMLGPEGAMALGMAYSRRCALA